MNSFEANDFNTARLRQVQGNLPVSLIMVPRKSFVTTNLREHQDILNERNSRTRFSYFPIEDAAGKIIGLYDASRWFKGRAPSRQVREDYIPLGEDILIGSSVSIFDFITTSHKFPTKLVVEESGIAGLVSLSDIQQLPV
jgi:hypothetical protein